MNGSWDWGELAFASKKPINALKATFIAAPREISPARFTQLVKTYLPKGAIVLGIAKEEYALGLEGQPQFRMLQVSAVQRIVDQVQKSASKSKISILFYNQRDLPHLLEKLDIQRAIFVNGSWYHAFHLRPEFYMLINRHISYDLVSPFTSEAEANAYADNFAPLEPPFTPGAKLTEQQMSAAADEAAKQSFAYSEHQTGVSLGRRHGNRYELLATTFNGVVPYQTYAMHYGASRERNFSPPNDLNHYDVNHAEIELLVRAQKEGIDLHGTTLFINLLPCPSCARMFTLTDITDFVYREDHSDGYAVKMLELAGKKVRRLVL